CMFYDTKTPEYLQFNKSIFYNETKEATDKVDIYDKQYKEFHNELQKLKQQKLKQAEKTKTNNENKYIKDEEINDDIRYILQKFLILFKCTNVIPKIDQLINIDSTEGVRDFMLRGPILHHLDVY